MCSNTHITKKLGSEYDQELRDKLSEVLKLLGAEEGQYCWKVGGSQEIEEMNIQVLDRGIKIESETYVGLSITGDEEVVNRIFALIRG